jgi:hypothetical protein
LCTEIREFPIIEITDAYVPTIVEADQTLREHAVIIRPTRKQFCEVPVIPKLVFPDRCEDTPARTLFLHFINKRSKYLRGGFPAGCVQRIDNDEPFFVPRPIAQHTHEVVRDTEFKTQPSHTSSLECRRIEHYDIVSALC